jgi:hypothetical protein
VEQGKAKPTDAGPRALITNIYRSGIHSAERPLTAFCRALSLEGLLPEVY